MFANLLDRIGLGPATGKVRARALISVPTVLIALAAPATLAGADEAKPPLRLCADPTNLPFSSDDPKTPGFYLELGEAIAKALNRPVAHHWYKSYFGKRTVRETLLSGQCDAMIGLPRSDDFMGPAVIFSQAVGREGYALVTAKGRKIEKTDDLKGLRVAVQFASSAQTFLAMRDDIEKVTVLAPEEAMKALDQGKADVAFIWGPVAGWLNKTQYGSRYDLRSIDGDGLFWTVAIGFSRKSAELRDQIDAVLPGLADTIGRLGEKYGIPVDQPVKFTGLRQPLASTRAAAAETATVILAQATAVNQPAQPDPHKLEEGKVIFNGTCAHCHGPDGVQSERHLDLRLLSRRHGDDMETRYWKAVHEGKIPKGMPSWKEVFSDEELGKVYGYLLTLQVAKDATN